MVYLLKMVIFHGKLLNNQMVCTTHFLGGRSSSMTWKMLLTKQFFIGRHMVLKTIQFAVAAKAPLVDGDLR